MRFTDIELKFPEKYTYYIEFLIPSTDELIAITNEIRKEYGNDDLVGAIYDNDVWYGYYLYFDIRDNSVYLKTVCNHGKNDDFGWYDIVLSQEEKEMLIWKFIKEIIKNDEVF